VRREGRTPNPLVGGHVITCRPGAAPMLVRDGGVHCRSWAVTADTGLSSAVSGDHGGNLIIGRRSASAIEGLHAAAGWRGKREELGIHSDVPRPVPAEAH
jgi:hypothetical protein